MNNINRSILALTAFNIGLITMRVVATHSLFYAFLVWNLVLSAVPMVVSSYLLSRKPTAKTTVGISLLWLLFFPNSPYIITDLLHFRNNSAMPAWFDVLLLTSFAISGILFGLLSMMQMQRVWTRTWGDRIARMLIPLCALLAGFGIYLGRYERYNSWDVLSDPILILQNSALLITELRVIGFTLGYGTLLMLVYYFVKSNVACEVAGD